MINEMYNDMIIEVARVLSILFANYLEGRKGGPGQSS